MSNKDPKTADQPETDRKSDVDPLGNVTRNQSSVSSSDYPADKRGVTPANPKR